MSSLYELTDDFVAIVQGGSRGIGLSMVENLLKKRNLGHIIATSRTCSSELKGLLESDARLSWYALDLEDEKSINGFSENISSIFSKVHLLINCSGFLHDNEVIYPEKKFLDIHLNQFTKTFMTNVFGPMILTRNLYPLLSHNEISSIVNISARIGSLKDNQLGGWYSYRSSKAALNMFTKNLAIEMKRSTNSPNICVSLHPGTVSTDLSDPFTRNISENKIFTPEESAKQLIDIIYNLTPSDSGKFFDWSKKEIPW
ncbi:MAG: SDR family oxidoreductase [SAR86 cluster bacterium]|nr:SDR family oxidoreductase [SAR86 cluster bacterium]